MDKQITATLEEQMPQWLETAVIPGLSLALINDGQIAWAKGFGLANSQTGEQVTSDTIFEAASLSKPVYAYAALQLCAAGILELDRPLLTYLPPAQQTAEILFDNIVNEPRLGQITTRHVLSHTPGFPNWPPDGENLRILLPPGQQFSYSGAGYMFLQQVVAQFTQHDPLAFIENSVLQPLGMAHSTFVWNEAAAQIGPVAQPHDAAGVGGEKAMWPDMYAAASLHCTPTDYARFMLALMSPDSAGAAALDTALLQSMLSPQIQLNDCPPWHDEWPCTQVALKPDLFWGLGWGLQQENGRFAFWHWGNNGNFKAFAIGFPDEAMGIVLMSNGRNGDKLWRTILQHTCGSNMPALSWLQGK
ncbi:MAG: serine hydrolase domain-containing protein [Chloroflexota bacterium]